MPNSINNHSPAAQYCHELSELPQLWENAKNNGKPTAVRLLAAVTDTLLLAASWILFPIALYFILAKNGHGASWWLLRGLSQVKKPQTKTKNELQNKELNSLRVNQFPGGNPEQEEENVDSPTISSSNNSYNYIPNDSNSRTPNNPPYTPDNSDSDNDNPTPDDIPVVVPPNIPVVPPNIPVVPPNNPPVVNEILFHNKEADLNAFEKLRESVLKNEFDNDDALLKLKWLSCINSSRTNLTANEKIIKENDVSKKENLFFALHSLLGYNFLIYFTPEFLRKDSPDFYNKAGYIKLNQLLYSICLQEENQVNKFLHSSLNKANRSAFDKACSFQTILKPLTEVANISPLVVTCYDIASRMQVVEKITQCLNEKTDNKFALSDYCHRNVSDWSRTQQQFFNPCREFFPYNKWPNILSINEYMSDPVANWRFLTMKQVGSLFSALTWIQLLNTVFGNRQMYSTNLYISFDQNKNPIALSQTDYGNALSTSVDSFFSKEEDLNECKGFNLFIIDENMKELIDFMTGEETRNEFKKIVQDCMKDAGRDISQYECYANEYNALLDRIEYIKNQLKKEKGGIKVIKPTHWSKQEVIRLLSRRNRSLPGRMFNLWKGPNLLNPLEEERFFIDIGMLAYIPNPEDKGEAIIEDFSEKRVGDLMKKYCQGYYEKCISSCPTIGAILGPQMLPADYHCLLSQISTNKLCFSANNRNSNFSLDNIPNLTVLNRLIQLTFQKIDDSAIDKMIKSAGTGIDSLGGSQIFSTLLLLPLRFPVLMRIIQMVSNKYEFPKNEKAYDFLKIAAKNKKLQNMGYVKYIIMDKNTNAATPNMLYIPFPFDYFSCQEVQPNIAANTLVKRIMNFGITLDSSQGYISIGGDGGAQSEVTIVENFTGLNPSTKTSILFSNGPYYIKILPEDKNELNNSLSKIHAMTGINHLQMFYGSYFGNVEEKYIPSIRRLAAADIISRNIFAYNFAKIFVNNDEKDINRHIPIIESWPLIDSMGNLALIMASAAGKNAYRTIADFDPFNWTPRQFMEVARQMTELALIDFAIGQVDPQPGNIYIYVNSKTGEVRVTEIDNDACLIAFNYMSVPVVRRGRGKDDVTSIRQANCDSLINYIEIIDERIYNKIIELSSEKGLNQVLMLFKSLGIDPAMSSVYKKTWENYCNRMMALRLFADTAKASNQVIKNNGWYTLDVMKRFCSIDSLMSRALAIGTQTRIPNGPNYTESIFTNMTFFGNIARRLSNYPNDGSLFERNSNLKIKDIFDITTFVSNDIGKIICESRSIIDQNTLNQALGSWAGSYETWIKGGATTANIPQPQAVIKKRKTNFYENQTNPTEEFQVNESIHFFDKTQYDEYNYLWIDAYHNQETNKFVVIQQLVPSSTNQPTSSQQFELDPNNPKKIKKIYPNGTIEILKQKKFLQESLGADSQDTIEKNLSQSSKQQLQQQQQQQQLQLQQQQQLWLLRGFNNPIQAAPFPGQGQYQQQNPNQQGNNYYQNPGQWQQQGQWPNGQWQPQNPNQQGNNYYQNPGQWPNGQYPPQNPNNYYQYPPQNPNNYYH